MPADLIEQISAKLDVTSTHTERTRITVDVGMVHRPFITHCEQRETEQPFVWTDGSMMTFDGRLDNREDLQRALGLSERETCSIPDLVLEAYRRLGADGLRLMIGDFVFALWDARRSELVLCTDSIGLRVLYYHVSPDYVCWSSRSRALLDALSLPAEIDEAYVAAYLANQPPQASPFREIEMVGGAHVVIATRDRIQKKKYWAIDPDHELRYRTDSEYEAHFRDVFGRAVECRLQADAPVFCELSGGLDSSAITCVADVVAGRGGSTRDVRTISYVFGRGSSSDESIYISAVEAQLGRAGLHLDVADCPLLAPLPASFRTDYPTTAALFLARWDQVTTEMQRIGARVLLTGMGGDQVFRSEPFTGMGAADYLAGGKLGGLVRHCSEWAQVTGEPFVNVLWKGGLRPLLPVRLRARLPGGTRHARWLNSAFVRRTHLEERMLEMPDDIGFSRPSSRHLYGYMRRAVRAYATDVCHSSGYYEMRYPFLDRRVVEFAMALPLEQKVRPAESRSIVRRALRGVVPQRILDRRTKSGPDEALLNALEREWPRVAPLFRASRVAEYGFVDGIALQAALQRARHGFVENGSQLFRIISLEFWLRSLEEPAPVPAPGAPALALNS